MFLSLVWSAWLRHQTVNGSCVLCVWLSCMLNVFISCVVCLVTPSDSKWLLCVVCFSLLCGLLGYPIRQQMALVCCVFFSLVWYVCLSHLWLNGSRELCVFLSCVLCVFLSCVFCLVTPSVSKWFLYVVCFYLLCVNVASPIRM